MMDSESKIALKNSPLKSFDYKSFFEAREEDGARVRDYQAGFHRNLKGLLKHHIMEGQKVLEVGCGRGDLLAALKPSSGLGMDLNGSVIERARKQYGGVGLDFLESDILSEPIDETFDAIVLDHLIGYLPDVQTALEHLKSACHERTRLYLTSLNFAWKPILPLAQTFGRVRKQPPSNWLSMEDIINILEISGWEIISKSVENLCPNDTPLISPLCNRTLVRCPGIRHLGATLFIVARLRRPPVIESRISCSVIVPVRNEAGNIKPALERIPVLGKKTEIIFVEGHSEDNTWETLAKEIETYEGPHEVSFCKQEGDGKWGAVHTGFARAKGDVLVIQDGDLTAPPEELPKFYESIASGVCEFANGSRLIYPMESQAMRFFNLLGNKFFANTLSFIIGQRIKDSLCGTKMILRKDYERLLERIEELGEFDPFGDFNLIFGSALLDLKIRDIPVRYRDRTYGKPNISPVRHGLMLFRMSWFGLWKLRFHSLCPRNRDDYHG